MSELKLQGAVRGNTMEPAMQVLQVTAVLALGAAAVLMSRPARAADTVYTDQATFIAATSGAATESFETLDGVSRGLAPIVAPRFTVSTTGTPIGVQTGPDTPDPGFGAAATDGTHYVSVYLPSQAQGTITFTLSGPSSAFGLALLDVGEAQGTVTLTTNAGGYSGGQQVLSFPGGAPSGAVFFAGLMQDLPFTQVSLTVSGIDEAYGLDDVRVLAVPEAGSAAMLAAGLMVVGGLLRRRSS